MIYLQPLIYAQMGWEQLEQPENEHFIRYP